MIPKFRAWDKENDEMLFPDDTDKVSFVIEVEGVETYDMRYPGDEYSGLAYLDTILMQYTGLKDLKGVEIYEGDIVQSTWYDVDNNPYKKKGEITFVGAQYVIVYDSQFDVETGEITYDAHSLTYAEDVEVIGNIYEQPELLGGQA